MNATASSMLAKRRTLIASGWYFLSSIFLFTVFSRKYLPWKTVFMVFLSFLISIPMCYFTGGQDRLLPSQPSSVVSSFRSYSVLNREDQMITLDLSVALHSQLKSIGIVFIQCNEERDIVRQGIWMYERPIIFQEEASSDPSVPCVMNSRDSCQSSS